MQCPKPISCTIDLTEGCNLACDYCFTHSNHKRRVIDEGLAKRIIDWWLPQTENKPDPVQLAWWGGEPLLEWELIKKLTAHAQEVADRVGRQITFGGTTNGLLMTPDKVEWMLKNKSLFLVSLDGCREAHDMHRKSKTGKGSWKQVDRNVRGGLKIAPQLKVRASFGPDNMKYFFKSIQYFFDDLGLADVAFSAVFEGKWTEKTWSVMEEQFALAIDYAVKRMSEGKPCVLKHLNDEACSSERFNTQNPCGAGNGYMAWSVDGFGWPCHRFNKHGLSTSKREKHPSIIARPVGDSFEWCNFEFREKFYNFKEHPPEKCRACEIYGKSTCNGGCYAVSADFTGDPTKSPEVQCRYNKIQHKMGLRFKKLADEKRLIVAPSGWNSGRENPFILPGCICYNMCYQEGTPVEITHIDRRTDTQCLCNMAAYQGGNNDQSRPLAALDLDRQMRHKFLDLSKRIIASAGMKKTAEQKKMELEVLEKTISMI